MTKKQSKPAPVLVARLPNNRRGRATLAHLRETMNRPGYKLRVLGSGPRIGNEQRPPIDRARVLRVYLDRRGAGDEWRHSAGEYLRRWQECHAKLQSAESLTLALRDDLQHEGNRLNVAQRALADSQRETDGWVRHGAEQACKLSAANQRIAHFEDLARRSQRAYNAIPPWCLWLAGAVRELRIRARLLYRAAVLRMERMP